MGLHGQPMISMCLCQLIREGAPLVAPIDASQTDMRRESHDWLKAALQRELLMKPLREFLRRGERASRS